MPTIKDVARRAGVSPITASRAFSGTHPVADDTRRRVLAAAEELGYVPDLRARGLVQKRSSIIGVLVPQLSNPFFVSLIDAVQAQAREADFLVIVSQSERRLDLERAGLRQLRQMRVAGALVTPISPDTSHLHQMQADGTAVVVLARCWEEGDYVTVDDYAGGRMAGEHLVRLGHRRVGCVALDEPGHTALQARIAGFRAAVLAGGHEIWPPEPILAARLSPDDGMRAADAFLDDPRRPTAVFVTADRLAIGFVHRLGERGVRVPDDVAVVGYDDIQYCEFLEIPLTTVGLPMYEMGRLAAQILLDRVQNGRACGELRQIELPPQLIVRVSCGARSAARR